jgi:alpha-galactosidase
MLEVGNGTLSTPENQAHFSMWALLAAPLLAGNDVRSMTSAVKGVLTNDEVVAIDQDPRGAQGTLVAEPASDLQIWSKPLGGSNERAVVLLNRSASSAAITVSFSQIGLGNGAARVRDLWLHADMGTFDGSYTASAIPSHGVAMLRIVQ